MTKTVGRGARSSVVPGFSFVTGTVPDYYQIILRVVLYYYVPCGSSRFLDGLILLLFIFRSPVELNVALESRSKTIENH